MTGTTERTFEMDLVLCGDVTIKLVSDGGDRIFGISFHTAWIADDLVMQLSRYEIDGTHKVKEKKDKGKEKEKAKGGYDDDFAVVLRFAPEAETPQPVVVENAALSKERHAIPETAKNPAPETKKEKAKRKSSNVMMNTSFDPIGAADPPERWSIMMAGVIPTATDGAGASEDGGHGAGGEGGEGGEFVALTDPSAPPSSPGTQGSAASPPSPTSAPGSRSSSPTRSTQSPSITIVGKDGNAVVHREAPTPDRPAKPNRPASRPPSRNTSQSSFEMSQC